MLEFLLRDDLNLLRIKWVCEKNAEIYFRPFRLLTSKEKNYRYPDNRLGENSFSCLFPGKLKRQICYNLNGMNLLYRETFLKMSWLELPGWVVCWLRVFCFWSFSIFVSYCMYEGTKVNIKIIYSHDNHVRFSELKFNEYSNIQENINRRS